MAAPNPALRSEENAIREQCKCWSAMAEKKDQNGFLSFYAPDAVVLPQGFPAATDANSIRQVFEHLMSLPGFALTFGTTRVEVASSGDLAAETGSYRLTANDESGKPQTQHGKYMVAWKKQPDGQWKALFDMFNADQ
jgi:ketosteroid isomerase-like protein